jgi:hypothetical protein
MLSTSGTSPEVGVTECSRHDAKEKKPVQTAKAFIMFLLILVTKR